MGATERWGSGTVPQTSDTKRTLLVKEVQATNTGGGGGGVTSGNYGGIQPPSTAIPASGTGGTIDTSTGRIWWYYNGTWH